MKNKTTKNNDFTQISARRFIYDLCKQSIKSNLILKNSTSIRRNQAIIKISQILIDETKKILKANKDDLERAKNKNLSRAFIDRLALTPDRIYFMSKSLKEIAKLKDPIGLELDRWKVPSGLDISKITTPIGIIGIIYESRPNVTTDSAGLCIKSGNTAILRCGTDSLNTCIVLKKIIQLGLESANLPKNSIQLIDHPDRKIVTEMLKASKYIDVIVPRGGKSLVSKVQKEARVPVFSHLDGNCHIYIDIEANISKARKICLNSKMRRVGICGAAETILVNEKLEDEFLKKIIFDLKDAGCEIRGDRRIRKLGDFIISASEKDWYTEYLAPIISIREVKNIDEAIDHINKYGSSHTETIITQNNKTAQKFLKYVDSAIVMHNSSTQFADGGEFGMGAEIGIATGRLHARGPVGINQLVSHKYIVRGNGHIRK